LLPCCGEAFAVGRVTASLEEERNGMLTWALIFLVVALVAGILGFGGVASAATGIARILFVVFLVIFLATTFVSLVQ
jgi:uncharacterized membrane protein YtjA (UPF0391 family)